MLCDEMRKPAYAFARPEHRAPIPSRPCGAGGPNRVPVVHQLAPSDQDGKAVRLACQLGRLLELTPVDPIPETGSNQNKSRRVFRTGGVRRWLRSPSLVLRRTVCVTTWHPHQAKIPLPLLPHFWQARHSTCNSPWPPSPNYALRACWAVVAPPARHHCAARYVHHLRCPGSRLIHPLSYPYPVLHQFPLCPAAALHLPGGRLPGGQRQAHQPHLLPVGHPVRAVRQVRQVAPHQGARGG